MAVTKLSNIAPSPFRGLPNNATPGRLLSQSFLSSNFRTRPFPQQHVHSTAGAVVLDCVVGPMSSLKFTIESDEEVEAEAFSESDSDSQEELISFEFDDEMVSYS